MQIKTSIDDNFADSVDPSVLLHCWLDL